MISLTMEMLSQIPQPIRVFILFLTRSQGVSLIVLSAAVYGLTMVVTKGALDQLPPILLLTVQTASSVCFFWTIIGLRRIAVPFKWSIFKMGFPGLLEPGISYLFGMFGLSLTTASNATFISTMEPVVTIALAWLLLKERISKPLIALGLVACVGVALIAMPDAGSSARGSLWGDTLIFLGVVFASLYAIATCHSIQRLNPVVVAAVQQSFALLFFLLILAANGVFQLESITLTPVMWGSLAIAVASGAFGYGTASLLYLAALRHQSAGRTSVYLTLIPIFGVLAAYGLLGERISLLQGLGGTFILSAVIGISRIPEQSVNKPASVADIA